ncbi:Bug family tripartite tricarboxylate transporter substrate binding protein [Ramlibacter sp.]|uniref:Bug family tripartite tricarboxylate transporter substrate binding protein n=1 Tax=Ramlibacter sp. TaxID=1917967 RepID=UPI003D0CD04B
MTETVFQHPLARAWGAVVLALAAATAAHAQDNFPSRPVTLVIPVAAGSASDVAARMVGEGLAQQLGQPVVAVNRPGGNNMVAVRSVLSSPGEGYSVLFLSSGIVVDQAIKKHGQFDVRKDLTPVARVVQAPLGLFVSNTLPVNSVKELVEYVKKNPGKVNFGSVGVGAIAHLTTEQFMAATGARMTHVPYPSGTAAVLPAMISGDVGVYINEMGSMRGFVQDRKIKLLATLADRRSPIYPDAPSIPELGMPELRGVFRPFFFGLFVEPGVPAARVEALANALNKAVAEPTTQGRLVGLGYDPALMGGTRPAEFRALIGDELSRTEAIVKNAKIQVQ